MVALVPTTVDRLKAAKTSAVTDFAAGNPGAIAPYEKCVFATKDLIMEKEATR